MWLPVFALAVLNPLFNPRGEHVLFTIFGQPYTRGGPLMVRSLPGVVVMMLWFWLLQPVMTSDKFMPV